jgi:hypothetical protein
VYWGRRPSSGCRCWLAAKECCACSGQPRRLRQRTCLGRWPCDRDTTEHGPPEPRAASWFRSHRLAQGPVVIRAAVGGALIP